MVYFVDDLKNGFDFFLRNHITFSRKNYNKKPQDLSEIFNEKQQKIYDELSEKYDLELLKPSARYDYLRNLYYIRLFDTYFSKKAAEKLSMLDIGSKNWEYAASQYTFFHSMTKNLCLNGIELDAYRLCTNFYNRYEISKFYTKNFPNTNYIVGDFMNHEQKYDYIIWILPFITKYPHLRWGLPLRYFKPEKMLKHAHDLLNDGGELLIVNQGEKEYAIQKELNERLNLSAEYYGEIEDDFNLFENRRYCCKIVK